MTWQHRRQGYGVRTVSTHIAMPVAEPKSQQIGGRPAEMMHQLLSLSGHFKFLGEEWGLWYTLVYRHALVWEGITLCHFGRFCVALFHETEKQYAVGWSAQNQKVVVRAVHLQDIFYKVYLIEIGLFFFSFSVTNPCLYILSKIHRLYKAYKDHMIGPYYLSDLPTTIPALILPWPNWPLCCCFEHTSYIPTLDALAISSI